MGTLEEVALRAAVLAAPACDVARLVLADYLEENGGSAYGTFIKNQTAAYNFPEGANCTSVSASWCPTCGDCCCPCPEDGKDDANCPLHAPESKHDQFTQWRVKAKRFLRVENGANVIKYLLPAALKYRTLYVYAPTNSDERTRYPVPNAADRRKLVVRLKSLHWDDVGVERGFIDYVGCSWNFWQTNHEAISAYQPVTVVKLTSHPTVDVRATAANMPLGDRFRVGSCSCRLQVNGVHVGPAVPARMREMSDPRHAPYFGVARMLLKYQWPTIRFLIPGSVGY